MTKELKIIFTKYYLDNTDNVTSYSFLYNGELRLRPGDLIESPRYSTPMQILEITERNVYPGTLKFLEVSKILESNNKKKKSMAQKFSMKEMFSGMTKRMAPEVDNNLRLSQNGICVPSGDGMVIGFDASGERFESPMITAFKVPVYIVQKPFQNIQEGDVIKTGERSYARVCKSYEAGDDSVKCVSFTTGAKTSFKPLKNTMLGNQMTVRCALNMFGNICGSGINPILLQFAQSSDSEDMDFEEIMKMTMISQALSGNSQMNANFNNPMVLMALLGKSGDSEMSEAMQFMMFSQMMQDQNGLQTDPFATLFGGFQQQPQTPVQEAPKSKSLEEMSVQELEALVAEKKRKAELIKELNEENK